MDINTIETKKNINKCKKCQCKCHCKQDLHADVYGICTCGDFKCSNPVNDGEECLSCQQRILIMKKLNPIYWIKKIWKKYIDWLFDGFYK